MNFVKYVLIKNCIPVSCFLLIILVGAGCINGNRKSGLLISGIFGDNMVLQQNQKIPIWGSSIPNSQIRISFRDQEQVCKADKQGKWMAYLEPIGLGEPDSLVIESHKNRKVFKNVQVGEVWLCSGQSNMQMELACKWAKVNDSDNEVSAADYPDIRLFKVGRNTSFSPIDTIHTEGWKICTPETVGSFSAVAYFFGRDIHLNQHVPIGLIQAAWGGTLAEAWTSTESLKLMDDFAGIANKIERVARNSDSLLIQFQKDTEEWLQETATADAGIQGDDTIFARQNLDDSNWLKIKVPGYWEGTKIGEFDGTVWYRKKIKLPSSLEGEEMILTLAPPDDADETWFNGVKIGESKEWNKLREYKIPAGLVKEGENLIAVRLHDYLGNGGFMGRPEDFSLVARDGRKITISGDWLCHIGYNKCLIKTIPLKPGEPNIPGVLFNAMIKPLIPFAIRGVIWYQGESNTGKASQYRELFPLLINDWRKNWQQGDFPFLFVQLANYMERNKQPVDDSWAQLREAQLKALKLPNTGMAVTIDIGDAHDIHPSDKLNVGRRLAMIARKMVHNEKIAFTGPQFKNMTIDEDKISIAFDFVYEGLKTSDGRKLKGFAIAGDDRIFYWAEATIIDNKIIVANRMVKRPVSVRYAWSSNPECNLVNSAGLPASPFRTDSW